MNTKRISGMAATSILAFFVVWLIMSEQSQNLKDIEVPQNVAQKTASPGQGANEDKKNVTPDTVRKPEISPEATAVPLWEVTIAQPVPGDHAYFLLVDGKTIPDPLNSRKIAGDLGSTYKNKVHHYAEQVSVFLSPPLTTTRNPKLQADEQLQFVYEGPLTMPAFFVADCIGGILKPEELRPLNDAARLNLKEIRQDQTLGGVSGKVTDEQGQPISGARVNCLVGDASYERPIYLPFLSRKTNSAGEFLFEGLPPSYCRLIAKAAGYQVSDDESSEIVAGQIVQGVEFKLIAAGSVAGIVVDPQNRPVTGAIVGAGGASGYYPLIHYVIEGSTSRFQQETDREGSFELTGLPPGLHRILARAKGYGPAMLSGLSVEAGKIPEEVELQLTSGGEIAGRVVQQVNGQEINVEKAQVHVSVITPPLPPLSGSRTQTRKMYTPKMYTPNISYESLTNGDGNFHISDLPYDLELSVAALMKGNHNNLPSAGESVNITLKAGERPEPLLLSLPEVMDLSGQVVDEADSPISGASLFAMSSKYPANHSGRTESDENGRFLIADIRSELRYLLDVKASGYIDQARITLPQNNDEELKIVLKPGLTLSGRVVRGDTGEGVERLCLDFTCKNPAYGSRVYSAADGSFVVDNLVEGDYWLDAFFQAQDAKPLVVAPIEEIKVGQGKNEVLIVRAWPEASISGRVVEQDGNEEKGLTDAKISFRRRDKEFDPRYNGILKLFQRKMRNGTNGEFKFNLMLSGEYELAYALLSEGSIFENPFSQRDRIQTVELSPGEQLEDVVFAVQRERGGIIKGLVLDPDGEPLPAVTVTAKVKTPLREHYEANDEQKRISDQDGRLEFSGLTLGEEYNLQVFPQESYRRVSDYLLLTEENPEGELVLQLQSPLTFSGRVIDQDGESIPLASAGLQFYEGVNDFMNAYNARLVRTNNNGEFEIIYAITEGFIISEDRSVKVTAEKNGYKRAVSDPVYIASGFEFTDIELVLEKMEMKLLRGAVTDTEGNPLADCDISLVSGEAGEEQTASFNAITNANGEFAITGANEENQLSFNYKQSQYQTGWFAHTAEQMNFSLLLGKGIVGRVIDADTGEPISDLSIQIESVGTGSAGFGSGGFGSAGIGAGFFNRNPVQNRTFRGVECIYVSYNSWAGAKIVYRPDGYFEAPDVNGGNYALRITGGGIIVQSSNRIEVTAGEQLDVGEIKVNKKEKVAMLTGRLVHAGTDRPYQLHQWEGTYKASFNTHVWLESGGQANASMEYEEEAGIFFIRNIPRSSKSLTITGSYNSKKIQLPELDAGGEFDLGDIELETGLYFKGRFVEEDGKPYQFSYHQLHHHYQINSAGKGDTAYVRITPTGLFWLSTQPDATRLVFYFYQRLPVELSDFGLPNENMEFDLGEIPLSKGITVRGQVLSPTGEPVSDAPIMITSLDHFRPSTIPKRPHGQAYWVNVRTNELGEYVAIGNLPGRLKIATTAGQRAWAVDLENTSIEKEVMVTASQELVIDLQFKK